MTKQENNAWVKFQMQNAGYWSVDTIHNGKNGQGFLAYVAYPKDATSGIFVDITTYGYLSIGRFTDAVPHIGDAAFTATHSLQCDNMNFAFSQACETFGLVFLKDLFRGNPPFRSNVAPYL